MAGVSRVRVAKEGYGTPGEINRVFRPVGYDLHDVRIMNLLHIFDAPFERSHRNFGIVEKTENRGINGRRIDERLVSLNVDHDLGRAARSDLGDAVCSGGMVG